jgi:hypothetical protein
VPSTNPNPFGAEPRRSWARWRRAGRGGGRGAGERLLESTRDEFVADAICAMLDASGIASRQVHSPGTDAYSGPAMYGRTAEPPEWGVYVGAADLDRATRLLAAAVPGDDELDELSRRSFEEITGHPPPPELLG